MRGAMLSRPAISLSEFGRELNAPPNEGEERANSEEIVSRVDDVFISEEGLPLRGRNDENDSKEEFPEYPPLALLPENPLNTTITRRLDVNVYAHKKTLAQGMMDLALLSANANQLRYVLDMGNSHPYYYPSTVLIATSLFLQIAVGVGLILNSQYNIKKENQMIRANRINNFTMIGIFLVTIINVFISAFSIDVSEKPSSQAVNIKDGTEETTAAATVDGL